MFCLGVSLRLMSPFMPYISEELNTWMPGTKHRSIMLAEYPSDLKVRFRLSNVLFKIFNFINYVMNGCQ